MRKSLLASKSQSVKSQYDDFWLVDFIKDERFVDVYEIDAEISR